MGVGGRTLFILIVPFYFAPRRPFKTSQRQFFDDFFFKRQTFCEGVRFDPPRVLFLGGVLPLLVIAWACALASGSRCRARSSRVLDTQCVTALVCRTGHCGHWNSLGTVTA